MASCIGAKATSPTPNTGSAGPGRIPIHEALNLSTRARDMDPNGGSLRASDAWDPAAFVDLCAAACMEGSGAEELCRRIQTREWQLLFDYCYRRAVGRG